MAKLKFGDRERPISNTVVETPTKFLQVIKILQNILK